LDYNAWKNTINTSVVDPDPKLFAGFVVGPGVKHFGTDPAALFQKEFETKFF
jgi:hypothetical protein